MPDGFPAYLRILHPAHGTDMEPLRWADVAARCGRTMHRLAQFHAISLPKADVPADRSISVFSAYERADTGLPIGWDEHYPAQGDLPSDLLASLSEVLARHTSTPQSCYFCLWKGHGWLSSSGLPQVSFRKIAEAGGESVPEEDLPWFAASRMLKTAYLSAPRVQLPHRDYMLFEGLLEAAGAERPASWFGDRSPNLFWPQDHAWCVASEIDLFCTLVGGSNELAESLLADPQLEVWRVFADDPVDWASDDRNK